jgi:molybdopterin converting factor small subunit
LENEGIAVDPKDETPDTPSTTEKKKRQAKAKEAKVKWTEGKLLQNKEDLDRGTPDPAAPLSVSPRRDQVRAEAYATSKKQGDKRSLVKNAKNKFNLEVGDVVDVSVTFKNKTKGGNNVINALVHEVLKGNMYQVICRAGVLDRKIARNDMNYRKDDHAQSLQITDRVALLPPVSESVALDLTNPMRKTTIHCNCKNVSDACTGTKSAH